jgi:hypothetical protein
MHQKLFKTKNPQNKDGRSSIELASRPSNYQQILDTSNI